MTTAEFGDDAHYLVEVVAGSEFERVLIDGYTRHDIRKGTSYVEKLLDLVFVLVIDGT